MPVWILLSISAAAFQTVRFMLQKGLSNVRLSPTGATFARFAYSAPLMVVGLALYLGASQQTLPAIAPAFWGWVPLGGLAQVLATVCVVALFKHRNFAVGVTLSKTDVVLTVLVGLVVLGDRISALGGVAVVIGLVGVVMLSKPEDGGTWRQGLMSRATLLGVGAGLFFAISGVAYRAAGMQVATEAAALRGAVSLAFVTSVQALGMAVWLLWRDRGELVAVWQARRAGALVGLTSLAGSFCWFWAFALQSAGYIRAVGQIELIFSLMASVLFFRETITRRELAGMVVLTVSILLLVTLG